MHTLYSSGKIAKLQKECFELVLLRNNELKRQVRILIVAKVFDDNDAEIDSNLTENK